MKITIYINTDSQAHQDYLAFELQRNMTQVTQGLLCYSAPHEGNLTDSNGNVVGNFCVMSDLEE
jgi:hypothetical protein